MSDHLRVELVQRTIAADEQMQAWRQQVAGRLAELGHIDNPDTGTVDAPQQVWAARINGTEVPVAAFGVEQTQDGTPMLSLVLAPDSLSIGEPPAGQSTSGAVDAATPSRWGDPRVPDPRAGIPGWEPSESLGAQVARNAGPQFGERSRMGWNGSETTA